MHRKGIALGSLCFPLCVSKDISSLTCHSLKATNKEAIFTTELRKNKLIFKSVSPEIESIHWHDNGILTYPTETEFIKTIQALVKNKFNFTLDHDTTTRLSQLIPGYKEQKLSLRKKEMDNVWMLIQDHEYLLSVMYTERDVFPQVLGTCGPYFAVEYLESIQDVSSILGLEDSQQDWARKLRTAVLIMDFVDELETGFKEPLYLCDIKKEHFGLANGGSRLKYLDLNNVYTKSMVNRIIGLIDVCKKDEDCELHDCKFSCNKKTNTCNNYITNNNLQIVCEKIFLGWRMSGRVLVSGLLMSQHTPSELASILRQCASSDGHAGKPGGAPTKEIKKRLYNTLVEMMEQSINGDFFM